MSEPGVEQPVEDVLAQQQDLEDEPVADQPRPPEEVDEADFAEQQIEVPLEDDR